MIISKTPYRISFFGGGTDYPQYFIENGGSVLATSINKYCYITCRNLPPFFEHKHRVVYSKIELIKDINDIVHPSVRETMKFLNIQNGVEIHHDGDLPARSGLGSSSAFTVGLLNALYALSDKMVDKMTLAKQAIFIEQNMIRENVGCQDQLMTAFGGLKKIEFTGKDDYTVKPVIASNSRKHELENHIMLFFTGISRTASEIAIEQIQSIPKKNSELVYMNELVNEAEKILVSERDISDFGKLLNESWQIKKKLSSKISTTYIDQIYEKALKAGAVGGKLLGAGGGGFMIFFVKPELQQKVRESLKGFLEVPFKFEENGSQIIYYANNV